MINFRIKDINVTVQTGHLLVPEKHWGQETSGVSPMWRKHERLYI